MDEKPKSIWKKSWTGWSWLRAWLIVVAATFFTVLIVTLFIPGRPRNFSDWWPALVFTLFVSVVVATAFVGLWAFARRFFCWRNFKRLLFGAACLATLIALFYAEEDWRGWHAWNKFKHEWEAKGEHFDFASMVPPPVPDDQNFALTPVVASSYLYILDKNGHRINPQNTNVVNRLGMTIYSDDDWKNCPTNGYWAKGTKTDLKGWQHYYRLVATKTNLFPVPAQSQSPAEDVLVALSKYDLAIEELRAASQLPGSRFPLNYDSESPSAILLPHLSALKRCSQALQLRSLAELQNSQPDNALADVQLALQLTDKIRSEPFLISHLVRIAMLQIMLQPVWEGLAEHKWSDEQLVALDAELVKLDFLPDYRLSMRGEMGCQGGEVDRLRHHPEQMQDLGGMSDGEGGFINLPGKIAARLIPTGWLYQNQFRCARMMVDYYLPLADVNQGTFSPALARRGDAAVMAEIKTASPFNLLERLMLSGLGNGAKKFAYAQSSVNLARTAIALERYRLAHGEYPESLDALAPQFITKLPHDIINGQPLHYRRTSDGQFVLYSVGWNEIDDGGVVGLTKNGNVDINTGDWVWRYPAK
ncbi:MAG: hypothetical protein ABSC89_01095 [Verrucomicrobiota bacterium]|jgi:hypothetical protein